MKSSIQIRNELTENVAKAEALAELAKQENREFTAEETAEITALSDAQKALNASLDTAIKYETLVAAKMGAKQVDKREKPVSDARLKAPIKFQSQFRPTIFKTAEDAYASGQWALACLFNNRKSKSWCADNGIRVKNAMSTGDNTKGGFLVPEPLTAAIIERREQYGVFARYAAPWQMGGPVDQVPRLAGEVTTYFIGEGQTFTASDVSLGLVRLEAKKIGAFTAISSEINEDSVISLAEILARSTASKLAYAEDDCGFNGDGTSTYGGIVGAENALAAGSIVTATGITTNAALTIATFESAVGKLPEYPGISPAWFFHKNVWANTIQRLMDAVGGNDMTNLAMGAQKMFLGYPVVTTQVLYSGTGATTEIFGYFGDLGMASYLGRRRGMEMKMDESVYFASDQLAIRTTQRFDINVYDRGTASAAGALVALKFG